MRSACKSDLGVSNGTWKGGKVYLPHHWQFTREVPLFGTTQYGVGQWRARRILGGCGRQSNGEGADTEGLVFARQARQVR